MTTIPKMILSQLNQRSEIFQFSALAAGLLVVTSCGGKQNEFIPPPPLEVDVVSPIIQNQQVYIELPGQTQAIETVEIRARVKGFLEEVSFKPGQFVQENQTLFKIEKEQFAAAVTTAKGKLAKAQADLEIANVNYQKSKAAFEKNQAVAEIDVLAAEAEKKSAEAAVQIANAEFDDANRDLNYATITAPIAGRVSKNLVDKGNLVGANDTTLLATVVKDNPIYVEFEISEREVIGKLEDRPTAEAPEMSDEIKAIDLKLTLADRSEFPLAGNFNYFDNRVNPKTGTIKVRAEFPNNQGALAAGMFVRIGIPQQIAGAILVPKAAIQRDIGGSFVMVVDKKGLAQRRQVVTTEFVVGEFRILESGLAAEDRVIVTQLQRVRPDVPVNPNETPPPKLPEESKPNPEPSGDSVDKPETEGVAPGQPTTPDPDGATTTPDSETSPSPESGS